MRHLTIMLLLLLVPYVALGDYSRTYIDGYPFASATTNNVEIAYKVIGENDNPPVVLIMGLGASHALWGDDFVRGVEHAGYQVILIDNRDTGGSSRFTQWGEPTLWWQFLKNQFGFDVDAPYVLDDMATDAIAVMDELNIEKAHIVGASMGGMIAQIIAAQHPERALSLVSIMSTTGAPHLPPPGSDSADSIRNLADTDGQETDQFTLMRERGFSPEAIPRQLMAIMKTGDRSSAVASIHVPTLVLHGQDDTLLPPAHGKHTADLIKGSEIHIFEGMGHNLPEAILPDLLLRMNTHMASNIGD